MATTISALPAASALDGTEPFPVDQATDTKRSAISALLTYLIGKTKVSVSIGDGVATSFPITHNFGTRDVDVYVYRTAAPYDRIIPDIDHTDVNTITVRGFATPPGTNAYRVFVRL